MLRKGLPWTSKEDSLLRSSLSGTEIAEKLGRTRKAVDERRRWLRASAEERSRRNALKYIHSTPINAGTDREQIRLPEHVLEERDRRAIALDMRDQTAIFFGDPPPGFSALDRKLINA